MPSLAPNILARGQTKIYAELFPAEIVTFDALISDNTDVSVTVTDHPIEDGADVTDHIRDNPDKLKIDILHSQTPANIPDLVLATANPSFFRHEDVWAQLKEWIKAHALVTVATSVTTWHHMAIESLSRQRTAAIGHAVEASITLKEIVKIKSSTALVPSRPIATQKPQAAGGKKTAGEAPPAPSIGAEAIFGG